MIHFPLPLPQLLCPSMAEKSDSPLKEENALLQNSRLFFTAFLTAFFFLDPFHMGPLGGHDYRPVKHELAPFDEVMGQWPTDKENRLSSGELEFSGEVFGPESIEFDPLGRGPYSGLADGRVVRWMGAPAGWQTFALVSANWSEALCANRLGSTTTKQHEKEQRCGRPLGLRFDKKMGGNLYIADAYHGLMAIGPEGGIAVPLASKVEGKPILFSNDVDIHSNGSLFFTDTSMRYTRRNHFIILLEGEATGRLLRYDPFTKTTHIVLKGLAFPNGIQLSKDQSFILFAETTNCRVMRFWLEGPKTGQLETFVNLPGFPDNIRMNDNGQFWVAIDCCRTKSQEFLSKNPWIRSLYFRLPFKLDFLARLVGMRMHTMIALLDEDGEVRQVLEDKEGKVMRLVSEVREVEGKLWIGTVAHNHIATLNYNNSNP